MPDANVEQATIDDAVQSLRPKLMAVTTALLSLARILCESGISSDVMKPIAAPIVIQAHTGAGITEQTYVGGLREVWR